MYRRSGETALSFTNVHSGDTLDYYKRGFNPYFRVYTINNQKTKDLLFKSAIVESFQNSRLLNSTTPNYSGNRWQFVDTYVDKKEDFVKVSIFYSEVNSDAENEFFFYINPSRKLY